VCTPSWIGASLASGSASERGSGRRDPIAAIPLGCGLPEAARTIATVIHPLSRPFSVRRSVASEAL